MCRAAAVCYVHCDELPAAAAAVVFVPPLLLLLLLPLVANILSKHASTLGWCSGSCSCCATVARTTARISLMSTLTAPAASAAAPPAVVAADCTLLAALLPALLLLLLSACGATAACCCTTLVLLLRPSTPLLLLVLSNCSYTALLLLRVPVRCNTPEALLALYRRAGGCSKERSPDCSWNKHLPTDPGAVAHLRAAARSSVATAPLMLAPAVELLLTACDCSVAAVAVAAAAAVALDCIALAVVIALLVALLFILFCASREPLRFKLDIDAVRCSAAPLLYIALLAPFTLLLLLLLLLLMLANRFRLLLRLGARFAAAAVLVAAVLALVMLLLRDTAVRGLGMLTLAVFLANLRRSLSLPCNTLTRSIHASNTVNITL
jgi:hypothetical protein